MDFEAIQKLIGVMNDSELYSLEVQCSDISIKMKKGPDQIIMSQTAETNATSPVSAVTNSVSLAEMDTQNINIDDSKQEKEELEEHHNYYVVTSPIVGTFYEASGPESEPFVKVGSKVKKGDALCIVEAMKLMNEIESEMEGEVCEILVKNGDMVQYNQPLFKIERR